MPDNKHTPGPWKFTEVLNNPLYSNLVCYTEWSPDRKSSVVAPTRTAGSHEANARLIAAAPDLLEALELLHRICLQTPALANPDDREVIDQAWAAIAKARGSQ